MKKLFFILMIIVISTVSSNSQLLCTDTPIAVGCDPSGQNCNTLYRRVCNDPNGNSNTVYFWKPGLPEQEVCEC